MNRYETVVATASSAVVIALAIRNVIQIRRQGALEREEIRRQGELDVAAIQRAGERIHERIDCGEFKSIGEVRKAFEAETQFQMIAIRES